MGAKEREIAAGMMGNGEGRQSDLGSDLFFPSLTLLSGSIINCKLKQGVLPLSSLSSLVLSDPLV